jgi:hypothetical protein
MTVIYFDPYNQLQRLEIVVKTFMFDTVCMFTFIKTFLFMGTQNKDE